MSGYLPDPSLITRELEKTTVEPVSIHAFEQLESTSGWLRENRLDSASNATAATARLCVTDSQVAGTGRRGKTWQTQPGNITFSLSCFSERQPQDLLGLSLVTGIAVAVALRDALSLCVDLKWPNDVIFNDAKLGGLLTEIVSMTAFTASLSAHAQSEIITGVGINVLHDPAVSALGIGATSLEEAGVLLPRGNRDQLIGTIAASILSCHRQFEREGWRPFENQWKHFDWLYGKEVSIHRESTTEHALALGVNHEGALLVERDNELKPLYGGEFSIRTNV